MLLDPPEAAHSNNAAPPAAPSIARQLLLFLALLLIVASDTATGAFAEASWQVDLAFDSSQDCSDSGRWSQRLQRVLARRNQGAPDRQRSDRSRR